VLAAACWAATPGAARGDGVVSASPGPVGGPAVSSATEPVAVTGSPGCSTATAAAPALRAVPTAAGPVPGTPFGVVVTADGRWAFVSLPGSGSVGVLRAGSGTAVPALARVVDLARTPGPALIPDGRDLLAARGAGGPGLRGLVRRVRAGGQPLGESLTPDGLYLVVADDQGGAAVLSLSRAERGRAGARLGTLSDPAGSGAIEVAVSPDGGFAFVSLEGSREIAVFNLRRALSAGFGQADVVGTIPVGYAPVGLAVSPDGRWLYVTSETAVGATPQAVRGGRVPGTLSVISLRRAETDPAASVVSTVTAGCAPVRVITSAAGGVVWVTARGSDRLLAFSAARLVTDPAGSLIAAVEVGEAPVGLGLVRGGTRIVVADSDRFAVPGASSSLAVVDVAAALAGKPALLGYLRAGGFPREMAAEPGRAVLMVTNFASGQLEAVPTGRLP